MPCRVPGGDAPLVLLELRELLVFRPLLAALGAAEEVVLHDVWVSALLLLCGLGVGRRAVEIDDDERRISICKHKSTKKR